MTHDDIRLDAKSDRELLIMLVDKVNHVCSKVDRHDRDLYNSGWGLITQHRILWMFALGGWAVALVWAKKVI